MGLGPVMLDIEGISLTDSIRKRLCHPRTGGVILFTRNFESISQISTLCEEIHALRDPHLLIAVDHEGGRVQRFREEFTRLPAAAEFGRIYDHDRQQGLHLAERAGWLMAAELRAVGVDFSFAPVLDLAHGISGVIGDRAFHRQPDVVVRLARAYIRGMRLAGMQAVGKHFPGHGGVREDSHLTLPVDERDFEEIKSRDLIPFAQLGDETLAGIMPAHVLYPQVDTLPAGFSRIWLQQILRHTLGFNGAIFSDDLSMAGAEQAGDYPARAGAALEAGCDMLLVCNHPEAAEAVLAALESREPDPIAQTRLARMHGQGQYAGMPTLQLMPDWEKTVAELDTLTSHSDPELNV